jgi:hypothetical protein
MAEGGGDSTLVVCVPVEVTVESETIGSAAFAINGKTIAIQNAITIVNANKLLRSLVDIMV